MVLTINGNYLPNNINRLVFVVKTLCFLWGTDWMFITVFRSCGGGFEYLHRDPASRRRRNGKSQIWDSKLWSRVPRDSDQKKTTLARASSIYKRQTRPLVREGAAQQQDRNCQRVINFCSGARHLDLLIGWPSIAMWLWGQTLILTWLDGCQAYDRSSD
jgi:hypothetical protein